MATLSITMNLAFTHEEPQPTDYSGQLDSLLTLKWTWDEN